MPALVLAAACERAEIPPAIYANDQCRRVAIENSETGEPIIGAEDIAVDWETKRLFISAYDRRSVERAARRKKAAIPQGGIYAVDIDDLFAASDGSLMLDSLTPQGDFNGGLRPHGVSYDAENHELVFINRTYERRGNKWTMTPKLQRIGANGEVYVGEVTDAPCSANNVLARDDKTYMSFDHGACNWRAGFEDVFKLKRSGLATGAGVAIFDRASFGNGIEATHDGDIALAATRENALIFLKPAAKSAREKFRIELPGGPDNLTIAEDGGIVAAVHPAMMRLAANRRLGLGRAPSRIVKSDPDTGEVNILFDDPTGKIFSAATVGVETSRGLVAGSVTDAGLLVCQRPA
ncbi:MAG: hypothetical protein HKN14_08260 [Marinicaulis sp.]|nr:hypothetical protein [Marinicaulis sp.]